MSVRAMSWVFEHSQATGNDRLVLLTIADQADNNGLNAFPSVPTIAHMSRVPARTVQRCLDRLEQLGELLIRRPQRQGRGHHNTYAVVMDRDPVALLADLAWIAPQRKGDTVSPFPAPESAPPGDTLSDPEPTPEGCHSEGERVTPGGALPKYTQEPNTPPPVDHVTPESAPVDERGPGEGDVDLANRDAVASFAAYLRMTRRQLGFDVALWTDRRVAKAISEAIDDGNDPAAIPAALRELAADPATEGPGRLKGAGPWWTAASRERRIAEARDLLAHAERTAERRRRDAELDDARRRHQLTLFEGLADDVLERLQREATVVVDEDLGRSQAVRPSDRIRARLIETRALQLAVEDGLVPDIASIDVDTEAAHA